MITVKVEKREEGQRFDKYLKKYLTNAGSGFIYKMLRKKNITLNDKKASGNEIICAGDTVKMFFSDETYNRLTAKNGSAANHIHIECSGNSIMAEGYDISIIYEDDDVIFFNKPAGLLSQKAKKDDVSLVDVFDGYMKLKLGTDKTGGYSAGICNRLDRNTSGIVAAGKSLTGLKELSALIKEHSVRKLYRCIVHGKVTEEEHLKGYLIKDEKNNKVSIYDGKDAPSDDADYIETLYRPLMANDSYSLLEVELITGKSHQIRAHLASIGHPIVGDVKYGPKKSGISAPRQMLHAYEMRFPGDVSLLAGKTITAPWPEDFERVYEKCHLGIPEV